jgi:hypothetical protein
MPAAASVIEQPETPVEVVSQQEEVVEPAAKENIPTEKIQQMAHEAVTEVPVEEQENISAESSVSSEQPAAQHTGKPKWRTWKEKIQGFIKKLFA